jgi:hypothetical protein
MSDGLRMISPPTHVRELMPLLSMMAFLGCAVLAFHNLFAPDRGGARVAYIWLSLPGMLVAAFAIGQLFFYDPGSISNPAMGFHC